MSITLTSPRYSFVNFNSTIADKCCNGSNDVAIPVIEENDLIFQCKINTETIAQCNHIYTMPIASFQLLLYNGVGNVGLPAFQNLLRNWTVANSLFFERYRTGTTEITFVWRKSLKDIKTLLPCNECFELAFYVPIINFGGGAPNQSILNFSNVFVTKCDDCFTSVLEYTNNEDYADFKYCNITNAINKVRLYMYLNQPNNIEDKAVYRKSNGAIRQTRSLLTKEYQAQTEHFPEHIHDKIVVALAHDTIAITSNNYTGGISKNGSYEISWDTELNLCKAPAKFKALATPYAIRNNNCADCNTIPPCPLITGLQAAVVDNNNGTQTITFTWNALDLTLITYLHCAGYLSPAIGGPPDFGQNNVSPTAPFVITVPVGIYNVAFWSGSNTGLCNFAGPRFINNVGVGTGGCAPVGLVGTPSLPNAVIGTPYSYSIDLIGDAPILIANVNKPSWMFINIGVANDEVVFSGTPNTAGTNVAVSFDVTNCVGANSVSFSDTLNITGTVQPGDAILTCQGGSIDPIPFGTAGTYNFSFNINTLTAGQILVNVHNNQAGSLNGFAMYYNANVTIVNGQTFIDVPLQYDGGGSPGIFDMIITITGVSGTDTCTQLHGYQ